MVGSTSASARWATSIAARIAATSPASLTRRSCSTASPAGRHSREPRPSSRSRSLTVATWASKPIAPDGRSASTRFSRSQTLSWSISTRATACRLPRCLDRVPEIGDENELRGRTSRSPADPVKPVRYLMLGSA